MTDATEKGGSLTARALWIACAKTLAFMFSFALPILLVRRLDQHEFGLYKQVFLVVGTAVAVLPLGFAMSAFYFLPREPQRRNQIVLNILLFNTAVGALACLALFVRPQLLASLFRSEELGAFAPLVGVCILFWIVSSFLEFIAVANQESRLATVFIVVAQLTKTGLMVAAALVSPNVETLIYAALAQGVLQTVVLLVYLARRFPGFWRGFEWATVRAQMGYALPLGLAGMLYTAQMDLHNYVVSYRFDAATFAVYAVGCFQLPLVGILNESVGSVMIPRVSRLQHEGRHREVVALAAEAMRRLSAVYLPTYVFMLVVGREFLTLLFTEQYAASWPVFAVNLTMLPLSVVLLDPLTRAYAEMRRFLVKLNAALVVLLAVALWFGAGRFGLVGVITTVVVVNALGRALTAFEVGRVVGARAGDLKLLRDVLKVALAALTAGAGAWIVRALLAGARPAVVLVACGAVFAALYAACVVLFKVPSADEREAARGKLLRVRQSLGRRAAAAEVIPAGERSNV